MFVIKNKYNAFVEQNTLNSKELNYVHSNIENVQHFSESEIEVLKERFKGTWAKDEFKVLKIEYTLKEV